MRKLLAAAAASLLLVLGAMNVAVGRPEEPVRRETPVAATLLARDLAIPVGATGAYAVPVTTLAGVTIADVTVSSGFAVEGGEIEFASPPRTIVSDTAGGLSVVVSFSVRGFTGSPSVRLIESVASPR